MQQIGTAQSVNQSSISTSSTHGVEGIRKNKITSGHYSVLDQIFPFFDRMTQIRPLFRFIHTLLYIWYFAQILNTSCFHITFHEEDNSFTGYMTWISLSNLNSASETTFLGMFLFFACCVLVSVIVICVQWYYYSKTRKFVNWMLRLIRFVFEAVTLITLIPAASFLGVLFLRVLLNRMNTLKYVYLCFMIIFILYTLVVHILTYQFIYSSPYLANTPFGSFNGGIILFPTIIYAIFAFISCFIRTFPTWSYSIVFLIMLIINVLIVVRSFSYPFLHMPFNVLYSSVFTGAIGCNAMAIVRVFVPNLFEYLPFTVGVVVMIISIFVYGFIGKKNNDFVKLKLNYPPNDESRMTEEEKHAIFQELNLINEAHGTKYLRLALFNGCDMLIDDSLIKYLIVSTNSTSVMISVLRIAACFPSMSRLMMVSLSRVISRRDISFKYRFVLYQIERITAIRNTSTSAEMTNQLNDIVNTTSILKKEITNFWLSIPNDPSIFRKLTNETTEANSRWTELLLKFPNNDRIHEEYAQFLIEVKTDFELAVLEHNKASMISVGKCQHLEKAFKLLMQNYPFYLKREILDVRGNIIKILNHKINPEKSGGTTASTFSQSSLGNSSTGFSSIDNELQLSIARSLFSHSRLRLALQGALKYRMSTNATYMLYWAAFVMIASFAVYLVQYFLLINFYDNRQANVDRMAAVADARTASCYALNYIASQWGLSTGAVMNHDELLNINKQHGGNTTIFLDPIGPSIYECAIWMRGNITNLAMEMGEIALSGLDIAEIAPSFLSEDVPYYPFVQTRMLEKEIINFKTLFSYMIYATGYLVMRIKDAPNWHKDDIFLSYMKNTEGFFTSMDDIYRGFVTETALAIRQISNGNILILCIPAVVIFLLSIPFYLVFHILYCRETKKWLRLLNGVDDKYKIEASRTLDPKEKKHDTAIVSEGGSVESSSFHSITATVIVFFYLLVTLICIFYGVISMKTDQEFINLNKWMIYGSVRASASMEAMGLLLAAATMNETFYLSSPNKSEVLNRALAAGKRMLNNHNILMNGKDGLIACLGYSAELDKIHNEQKCDITQTNSSYHDIVQCNSLSQNIVLANNYVAILCEKLRNSWGIKDIELFELMHLVNKHLFDDLDHASTLLMQISVSILNSFKTNLLILTIVGYIVSLMTFMIIFFVNGSLKTEYRTIMQIIRRLPPSCLATSPDLLKELLNNNQQQKKEINSTSFAIIDKSHQAIICCNKNDSIELVNPAVSKLLGFTPDQLLGQSLSQIIQTSSNEDLYRQVELMKCGESQLVYETHIKCSNDSNDIIPCSCTLLGMDENKGHEISSYVLIVTDETELLRQQTEAEEAKTKSENLLYQILPRGIVVKLNAGEKNISFVVNYASIIFIDIVAFSEYTAMLTPQEIMGNLSTIFGAFDNACAKYNHILKIKLIGDVYMAASGLFTQDDPHQVHAEQIINFGLEAISLLDEINVKLSSNLQVRVGVNSGGPLIAGVLGTDKPVFDIIGDPINVASRLQSTDLPGHIQIPQATFELISGSDYHIDQRGEVFLKGKGKTMAYLVKPKVLNLQNSNFDLQSGSLEHSSEHC